MELKGARILISGASNGIGRALAVELGRRGAWLALLARSRKGLAETAAQVQAAGGQRAVICIGDVGKASVRAVAAKAIRQLGGLDALVNNAGIHALAPVAELPEAMLQQALNVNLFGVLRLTQASLPALRQSRGLVVNIGSNLGYRAIPNAAAYCSTKGALARFTESLRDEEARNGVHVLLASPGVVKTGLRDHALRFKTPVTPSAKLPFAREAGVTAREIADAMRRGEREMLSGAFPVKIWAKVLAPWFGGFLDGRMKLK
jgi:short-subunit dehydrogenase